MLTFTIRQLNRDDASSWAELRFEALSTTPLAFGATPPASPRDLIDMAAARLSAADDAAVFGAFVAEALKGIVGIRRAQGEKERHKCILWGMYVAPSARRSGIGEALVGRALECAREWAGVLQVHLAVSEAAPEAERLYARLGFRAWGREPRALRVGGTFVDETHMVAVLDI